jgi:hypothetical protein
LLPFSQGENSDSRWAGTLGVNIRMRYNGNMKIEWDRPVHAPLNGELLRHPEPTPEAQFSVIADKN